MAKDYSFKIFGHPNIYNNYSPRELMIYFSEPDSGVNENTGIVLLISGFGGNANSNVYKKMRCNFADKYNLVTVQCDYFGWEFMQSSPLPEGRNNFNDMGLMQALDNITAVVAVEQIIADNNLKYNAGKIIAYGHSHGAYISYLCNVMAPNLFSLIIDNSAWLFPQYIYKNRELILGSGNRITFKYHAIDLVKDKQILDLNDLYKGFINSCKILSFHGEDDTLIGFDEKERFCNSVPHCELNRITETNLDNIIFKSSTHGLGADFLLMFDSIMNEVDNSFTFKQNIQVMTQKIRTNMFEYTLDYSSKLPIMSAEEINIDNKKQR